ncbi:MAG: hypothetical protein JO016_16200 [Actinobacteria bacterium]|nr:hypothetical protein [Actinomycetota bacterium]
MMDQRAERKGTLILFLIALNRVIDATRKAVAAGADDGETASSDSEEYWSAAFKRYMECCLYFPADSVETICNHLQEARRWRRKTIESGQGQQAPTHEDFIYQMRGYLPLFEKRHACPSSLSTVTGRYRPYSGSRSGFRPAHWCTILMSVVLDGLLMHPRCRQFIARPA